MAMQGWVNVVAKQKRSGSVLTTNTCKQEVVDTTCKRGGEQSLTCEGSCMPGMPSSFAPLARVRTVVPALSADVIIGARYATLRYVTSRGTPKNFRSCDMISGSVTTDEQRPQPTCHLPLTADTACPLDNQISRSHHSWPLDHCALIKSGG
jgi:hypothetical protein